MDNYKDIPINWKLVKLREVCRELQSGKRPKGGVQGIAKGVPSIGAEHLDFNGGFKFSKIKFVPNDFAEQMKKGIIQKDDIIVVKDGATTGKVSFVRDNFPFDFCVINEHVFILRVTEELLPPFAFYKMWSSQGNKEILQDFRGAAQGGISTAFIDKVTIPLPSIKTQQAIISKIEELFSELDKGIENLKIAQQQLKVYRQSVLKWAFEGKLTNKNVKEGELPKGWKLKKLNEVAEKIFDGPFGSNLKSIDYTDKGIRVIRLENIGVLTFKDEYKTFISEEKYFSIEKHTVRGGDIIFSSFIIDEIRVVVLPNYIVKAINKADCFCIRTSIKNVNRIFLAYFLSTKAVFNQLVDGIHGATRPRINTKQLKGCLIPFPPIQEQNFIVQEIESRLSVADKLEESINQSLQQSEALRQSILKKAFEGKLVSVNEVPEEKVINKIKEVTKIISLRADDFPVKPMLKKEKINLKVKVVKKRKAV